MSARISLFERFDPEAERDFAGRMVDLDASTEEGMAALEALAQEAWDRVQVLALLRAVPPGEENLPIGSVTDALIGALDASRAHLAIWRAARCASDLPADDAGLRASQIWTVFRESLSIACEDFLGLDAELECAVAEAAEGELDRALDRARGLAAEAPDRYGFASLENAACAVHLAALLAAASPADPAVDQHLQEVADISAELPAAEARALMAHLLHVSLRSGRFALGLGALRRAITRPPEPASSRPVLARPYLPPATGEVAPVITDLVGSLSYPPLSGATLMNLFRLEQALQESGQPADAGVVAIEAAQLIDDVVRSHPSGANEVEYAAEVLADRGMTEPADRILARLRR